MPSICIPTDFHTRGADLTDIFRHVGLVDFVRRTGARRLAIISSLLFIVLAGGASLFIAQGVDRQLADVVHTYDVRQQVQQLYIDLLNAETGQRGYLLTRDPVYLAPYNQAITSIASSLDRLLDLTADSPSQRARVTGIVEEIERKRAEMAATLDLAATGRFAEAQAVISSDMGNRLMTTMRDTAETLIAQEDRLLVERNAAFERYRLSLIVAVLAALAGAAALAYAIFAGTQREVSVLAQSQSLLRSHNEELERGVRQRTVELEEARAHAERERQRVESLLQETNHRIGNSLATVSSLLALQVSRTASAEVRKGLEAAQMRIQTVASGHRRLRLGGDLETAQADEFLQAVVDDIQSTQPERSKVRFSTRFEPIVIMARDATTLGIILGELVTNALKHAFPDGRPGEIALALLRQGDGSAVLEVADDGIGLAATPEDVEGGLGAMIIAQLARQFGGDIAYESRSGGGTRVRVTLPGLSSGA